MTKEEFWSTIEAARQAVPDGSQSMIAERIFRGLLQKPPEDVLDWNLYSYEYRDAACHKDLRAAGTALGVPPTRIPFLISEPGRLRKERTPIWLPWGIRIRWQK